MKRKYRRKRVAGAVACLLVCLVLIIQGTPVLYHAVACRIAGTEGTLSKSKYRSGKNGNAVLTKEEKNASIPLLFQWDKRWGECSYGNSVIGVSGCAPTCLSMVIVGLTGQDTATPDVLAAYAEDNGFYVEGIGTAWRLMTEIRGYGVVGEEIPADETVVCRELSHGNPIICSMGPGDFTTDGHFIVLAGVEEGRIRVHDPNSSERSKKMWNFSEFQSQIRNLWVFRKE